jgi:uncharacterized protein
MLIAVISDSHDIMPDRLAALLRGADEIWHLGDVMAPHVLVELSQLGLPLRVVCGNCDYHQAWPQSLDINIEGVRCHLVHIPPSRPPAGVHVVLHGHTHIPRDYTDHLGVRWLNPGSVSKPRGGFKASHGWLEIRDAAVVRWEIMPLS